MNFYNTYKKIILENRLFGDKKSNTGFKDSKGNFIYKGDKLYDKETNKTYLVVRINGNYSLLLLEPKHYYPIDQFNSKSFTIL